MNIEYLTKEEKDIILGKVVDLKIGNVKNLIEFGLVSIRSKEKVLSLLEEYILRIAEENNNLELAKEIIDLLYKKYSRETDIGIELELTNLGKLVRKELEERSE